jgi:hypothetical protein
MRARRCSRLQTTSGRTIQTGREAAGVRGGAGVVHWMLKNAGRCKVSGQAHRVGIAAEPVSHDGSTARGLSSILSVAKRDWDALLGGLPDRTRLQQGESASGLV